MFKWLLEKSLAHRLLVTLARRLRDAEEPDQIL